MQFLRTVDLAAAAQAPNVTGPLAQQNLRSYRRYAALQQVLSLGHAVVSVEPEVLLLSDPQALLQQHPTDVTIMSTAWGDEHSAYGEHGPGPRQYACSPLSQGLLGDACKPTAIAAAALHLVNTVIRMLGAQDMLMNATASCTALRNAGMSQQFMSSHPLGRWPYIICHHPTPTHSYFSSNV